MRMGPGMPMGPPGNPAEPWIPFNRPYMTGRELHNIAAAHALGHLSGDGSFTAECASWLERQTGASRALLTHSCTAALEMSALLLGIGPGDEVIMPSYTFVSTANAVALRGATPVFVDIRPDTLNIDEELIEAAITPRTRAVWVVHYAGVAAEMDAITELVARRGLRLVEDAAQALMSTYRGRSLGTLGDLGTLSFHETKNVTCGEGGALLCRDGELVEQAEIVREKGTDRSRFARGQVDKYTWVDVGSSFLPAEVTAAFLAAQLHSAEAITARRIAIWESYHDWAGQHEAAGRLRRPVVPAQCGHNAHMFYLILPSRRARDRFIEGMADKGILSVFHYVPLHSSPMGRSVGRVNGPMAVTDDLSGRLVRMPLWLGVEEHLERITRAADHVLSDITKAAT